MKAKRGHSKTTVFGGWGGLTFWKQNRLFKMEFRRNCTLNVLTLQDSLGKHFSVYGELVLLKSDNLKRGNNECKAFLNSYMRFLQRLITFVCL